MTDVQRNIAELQAAYEDLQQRYGRDSRLRQMTVSASRHYGRSPWPPPPDPLAGAREVAARHCAPGGSR